MHKEKYKLSQNKQCSIVVSVFSHIKFDFLSLDRLVFVFVFGFHLNHLKLLEYFVCVVGVLFDFRVVSTTATSTVITTTVVASMTLDRFLCTSCSMDEGAFRMQIYLLNELK